MNFTQKIKWTLGLNRWVAISTIAAVLLSASANATSLSWDWTQGDGAAADGFKIHYGAASGVYTNHVDTGLAQTWTLPDAWPDGTYYFAASAYNHCCDPEPCEPVLCESAYSNEAVWIKSSTPSIQPASGGSYQLTWIEEGTTVAVALPTAAGDVALTAYGTRSNTQIGKPANTTSGDLLIAALKIFSTSISVTPPSGWTLKYTVTSPYQAQRLMVFYLNGYASGGPWNFTHTSSDTEVFCQRLTGAKTGDPFDTDYSTQSTNYAANITCSGIDVSVNGSYELMIVGSYYGNAQSSSTITEVRDYDALWLGAAAANAGDTGNETMTVSSEYCDAVLFAINPPSGSAFSETATDGIAAGEALARISTFRNTITDGFSGAESSARISAMAGISTDGAKLAESLARIVSGAKSASDGLRFAEPLSPQTAYADSLTVNIGSVESGALSDTYAEDSTYLKLNEITGAPPTFDYVFDFTGIRGNPESVIFRGRYTGNSGHVVMMQAWDNVGAGWIDIVRITHSESADSTYIESILDPKFVASETVKIRFYHPTAGSSTHDLYVDQIYVTYNFGIDGMLTGRPSAADGFVITDSALRSVSFSLSAADGAAIGDSAARRLDLSATLSDGCKLADVLATSLLLLPIVIDGARFGETITTDLSGILEEVVSDGLKAGESASSLAAFIRAVADRCNLSESVASILSASRVVTDGAVLSDQAYRTGTISRTTTDGIIFSDLTIEQLITGIIQEILSDGFRFSETTQTVAAFDITVADGARISEVVGSIMSMFAAAADAFKISDSASISTTVDLATGRVKITFTMRRGGQIVFTLGRPRIDFTLN